MVNAPSIFTGMFLVFLPACLPACLPAYVIFLLFTTLIDFFLLQEQGT
jgi:hypothetical protein